MPSVQINGVDCEFTPGETILQVAVRHGVEIPYYCYHDGLSVPAQCRICLAECWAPNPRNENKLEPMMGGKLVPTCATPAADGMVVHADSPKSVANQKAVMEYLLINHPLDCPVCDQAGECHLQDYSYKFGRGSSRFEETKLKQAKKDLGPHVYLYADRCIMCTRCVRFTREVAGTGEIDIVGRGNKSEIDVFPGVPLENELSANVIDLCPVGALLDKDFLFAQRVWFLKSTPGIDGLTASGDNILIEHNQGKVYRFKPRSNMGLNKHWITDEVRYSWKWVSGPDRLTRPLRRQYGALVESDWNRAIEDAVDGVRGATEGGKRLAVLLSPMLTCEDAYALLVAARRLDDDCVVGIGPVPIKGEDKAFPVGIDWDDEQAFRMYAEKAPNARGVRRVAEGVLGREALAWEAWLDAVETPETGALLLSGNYPSDWATGELMAAMDGRFCVLVDVLGTSLVGAADVVLPGAAWVEKAGTFENARGMLQAFEAAVPTPGEAKSEGQIGLDLLSASEGEAPERPSGAKLYVLDEQPGTVPEAIERRMVPTRPFNAADVRREMAGAHPALSVFVDDLSTPPAPVKQQADMAMIDL
ncbi:MAG: hypothetical protein EA378_06205 [Phycisphaerales bacterium]|nr:MAG: hypothetical protein EA378_06205 [Phycisphaerales bacterium]